MSLDSFSSRIRIRADNLEAAINRIVVNVALVVDQVVVLSTPVDTGRARSNWQVSLRAPINDQIEPYAPGLKLGRGETGNAQAALSQAQAAVRGRRPGRDIFITNNVEYIGDLNRGTSAQAPAMFVQIAIVAGVDAVARAPLNSSRRR